ncbi:hypothetical protein Rhe02_17410 [Rhizocola hellebori]|uniref:Uncharacterized protein n=1 Tax=Rhizocola hellebori TaxID=1392758 RepID=A0A8J3Q4K0_9ACTN|nr:hypothetical protein [Rhizocola hellebori]GIH03674.1 hypothetical protein Rhe02_17410 [Rhizocola hellebori]
MTKIENLLQTVAADPHAPAWSDLYHEVCHQGQCYPDSFPLLPDLAVIAAGFTPADRDQVLIFAGNIAADLDQASRARYAEALATLHQLTETWLPTPIDPQDFIYRLKTVLALEGDEVWGKELDRVIHDEIEVECPTCGTYLFVVFGEHGHFATHEDYAIKPDVEHTPLLPALPHELTGAGQRLHTLSLQAQQAGVAEALTYVFGCATCTQCSTSFRVSDQVEAPGDWA